MTHHRCHSLLVFCCITVLLFAPSHHHSYADAVLATSSADPATVLNGNHEDWSFGVVKSRMYNSLEYGADPRTIYCNCPFSPAGHSVDVTACNLQFRLQESRMARTEAEHVVPAAVLCGRTAEWQSGGRSSASKVAPCSFAYTDLHNLWPAAGEINVLSPARWSTKPSTKPISIVPPPSGILTWYLWQRESLRKATSKTNMNRSVSYSV
jgi:hypothetical protein